MGGGWEGEIDGSSADQLIARGKPAMDITAYLSRHKMKTCLRHKI